MKNLIIMVAAGLALVGCDPECSRMKTPRVEVLDAKAWASSEWISVKAAKVAGEAEKNHQRAADGTSCFWRRVVNAKAVKNAKWMTSGLGTYELYLNGKGVGRDFLKPGFTHVKKTRRSFTYDVTALLKTGAGEANDFGVEVSAGWWRDKIVNYTGLKSAFRGVIELTYEDGSTELVGTKASEWFGEVGGPVTHAGIFDGEEFDARKTDCARAPAAEFAPGGCEVNGEFKGEVLPTCGAEICLRCDKALRPVEAYNWKGETGSIGVAEARKTKKGWDKVVFGTVVKTTTFDPKGELKVLPGETLIVDFGQNCAGVPAFEFVAKPGVTLTCLPGEMLNDANGERSRGNDNPSGSLYRENLRIPEDGMRLVYTFATDKVETYMPRYTFFGYRYLSITTTDEVKIRCIASVPVTSITKEMETGRLETGVADVNKFISNVYWGQLSNYLSVPTDCPQRNERLGWCADTQVFAEAGAYNADTSAFFHKWTRDLRDSRCAEGGYPSVAPFAQYGNETFSLGWADVGVIVPWTVWKMFGDTAILEENFDAMAKFVRKLDETKYDFEGKNGYIYADWLSYETFETCGNSFGSWGKWKDDPDAMNYRRYLAACYWLYDARLMVQMAEALGKADEAAWFKGSADRALAYIRGKFIEPDGLLLKPMRNLQTACVFALHFGIVEGKAKAVTLELLKKNIREHGDCLQTGFLGTSFLMDALSECGETELCYTLLLQHKNPSWLYSVDQGATTIWERWNSYTKDKGFGPVGMNSFNHYAYGQVLGWMYRNIAGIAADPAQPGFKHIIMKPLPDKRLGFAKAEYRSRAGLITSAWRYEGDKWIWDFTVPEGATASVTLPGESAAKQYPAGTYRIER